VDGSEHLALSSAASAAIYIATGDAAAAAAFSVMGVLIDLDHLIDYFRETGFNVEVKRFLAYFEDQRPRHLWLLLHGFEWMPLTLAGCLLLDPPAWAWAGVAGWFLHLLLDHRHNQLHPLTYWLVYRARLGFRAGPLFRWKG